LPPQRRFQMRSAARAIPPQRLSRPNGASRLRSCAHGRVRWRLPGRGGGATTHGAPAQDPSAGAGAHRAAAMAVAVALRQPGAHRARKAGTASPPSARTGRGAGASSTRRHSSPDRAQRPPHGSSRRLAPTRSSLLSPRTALQKKRILHLDEYLRHANCKPVHPALKGG